MNVEDIINKKMLDEEIIELVEKGLHEKNINIETQDEIIKYLYVNKKLFGHIIDTKKLAEKIIENIERSIVYFGTDTSKFPKLYKSKINIITSILSMGIVGGYYHPYSKEVYLNPLVQGKITKKGKENRESIFMHEIDHCATTSYVELEENEKQSLVVYNEKKSIFRNLMKLFQGTDIKGRISRKIKVWDDMTKGRLAIIGVHNPKLEMKYNISLERFNEGITVLKQQMYSKVLGLNFNKISSSSYLTEPYVAEFVANKIGLDNLILLQQNNDYEGIRKKFNEATGQDLNDLVEDLNKIPVLIPVSEKKLKKKLKIEKYEEKEISPDKKSFVQRVLTTGINMKEKDEGKDTNHNKGKECVSR